MILDVATVHRGNSLWYILRQNSRVQPTLTTRENERLVPMTGRDSVCLLSGLVICLMSLVQALEG